MEPDFDKILSNKIHQIERRPVPWNKQTVWENVQSRTGATQNYYLYSAAAAMILLLVYFVAGLSPDKAKPQVTKAKVITRHKESESPGSVFQEKKKNEVAPTLAIDEKKNTATKIPDRSPKTTKPEEPETENIEPDIEPVMAAVQLQKEETPLPEITAEEQRIRPVVGVIVESGSETITNLKRKKPLRKLKSPDAMPWEDPKNALLFVVKK